MQIDEVIENLEAETLQLLKDNRQRILKIEIREDVYIALEMRGYFALNHRLVCGDWLVQLSHKIDKPYEVILEPIAEITNLFKSDEIAIPRYSAPFKYYGM